MASRLTPLQEPSVETDFHQWALDTAEALRKRNFTGLDWEKIAEEIESLGISQETQLASRCSQLMYHLLKVQHQPERHSRSWDRSIRDQRSRIKSLLRHQPSLKAVLADPAFWTDAYKDVVTLGIKDNVPDDVLNRFPQDCPFDHSVLDD